MTQESSSTDQIPDSARTFVQEYMRRYDSSHDWSHIQRVVQLAEHIANIDAAERGIQYDLNVVRLAALLHDVGDAKYAQPGDLPAPIKRFLLSAGASHDLATTVQDIADRVSFSKEEKDPDTVQRVLAKHPELAAVQDADRLDAIGAIGVGRCFTFGAAHAEREHVNGSSDAHSIAKTSPQSHNTMDKAIQHFDEKLIKLESMMKTQEGRRIAKKRTERLVTFRDWWLEEQRGRA